MDGDGHAPMSSVRRSFSSVMLCMATSVSVSSTGSSKLNLVFVVGSSVGSDRG